MKKKLFAMLMCLSILGSLCACGKKESEYQISDELQQQYSDIIEKGFTENVGTTKADTNFSSSKEKGTRNNPYKIGDTVIVEDVVGNAGIGTEYSFVLKVTVNKHIKPENFSENNITYSGNDYREIADVSFELDGDYSNGINVLNTQAMIKIINENMEENNYFPQNHNFESLMNYYTNNQYDWYYVGDSDEHFKYVCIVCNTPDGIRNIWVSLDE